MGIFAGVEETG